jgi:hypothetical protein
VKILYSLLAVVLFISPGFGQQKSEEPAQNEYNVGFCGSEIFTIAHLTIINDKITFTHTMSDPQTVVKQQDPLVFDYHQSEKDLNGNTPFEGAAKSANQRELKLKGLIRKNKIIALLFVDNKLAVVLYGTYGTVNDMVKLVEVDASICLTLRQSDVKTFPDFLMKYLTEENQ